MGPPLAVVADGRMPHGDLTRRRHAPLDLEAVERELRERRDTLRERLTSMARPPERGAEIGFGKRIGEGTTEAISRLTDVGVAVARGHRGSHDPRPGEADEGTYGTCDAWYADRNGTAARRAGEHAVHRVRASPPLTSVIARQVLEAVQRWCRARRGWLRGAGARRRAVSGRRRRERGAPGDGSEGEVPERLGEQLGDERHGQPSADQSTNRELVAGDRDEVGLGRRRGRRAR